MKSEIVVTAVYTQHGDVVGHQVYGTLRDLDLKREKKEEAEKAEKNKVKELVITEKWKPHQQTIKFFEEMGHRYIVYSHFSIGLTFAQKSIDVIHVPRHQVYCYRIRC
jgi:hypothetical protein